MKYMGSKNRIAKYILPIILKDRKDRKEGQWYVEPFVGGCNTIDKVTGNRLASDSHSELIAMWKAIQEGWEFPDTITESDYNRIRYDTTSPAYLKGYVGFNASYSGKWWGGMARYTSPQGKVQQFDKEAHRFVTRQLPYIKDIVFECVEYDSLICPKDSLIYCDPPYRDTTKYKSAFDHEKFYEWCRSMKLAGHTVYISEYTMPEDFICVWSKERRSSLTPEGGTWKIEKLFTL
jgi:DNA adenine methylase